MQHLPPTPSSTTDKGKRHDRWSQRSGTHTPTTSATLLPNGSISTDDQCFNPTKTTAPHDDGEGSTQVTWPDTADDTKTSAQATTPTPERRSERRSQRPRKTSYADILAQSKYRTIDEWQTLLFSTLRLLVIPSPSSSPNHELLHVSSTQI